jgi:hypothetical protein
MELVFLSLFFFYTQWVIAQEGRRVPVMKTGFDAMYNMEQLPLLFPNGTLTKQPLAYDATGRNWDHHFMAAFTQYVDSVKLPDGSMRKEYVIYDEMGPGVLYRQQMNAWYDRSKIPNGWLAWGEANQPRADANICYYFDDEKEPRINMHLKDFFGTKIWPYTEPLAFVDSGYLFANLYYPFTYKKRLKVTMRPNAKSFEEMDTKWYQYTALSFPADYPIDTWDNSSDGSEKVIDQWNKSGENPNNLKGCTPITTNTSIKKGASATLFTLPNSGSLAGITIQLKPYNKETLFNTLLKIYWDDNTKAAIELPLGYFFGAGAKDYSATVDKVVAKSLTTLLFGFNPEKGELYAYWPMPFWKSAKFVLENHAAEDISQVQCKVWFKPSSVLAYDKNKTGYFMVKRTTDADPDTLGFRSVAFEETGRGHVTGVFFYSDRYDMDGDEFTYIDDSRTPQIHGSGTEDDHNQGWAGRAYQKPLWGGLVNGYDGAYRIYLNDCYIFNKNILITYEYSLMKPNLVNGGSTDVIIYYYKSAANSNLVLTDELDPGNHFSERGHQYKVEGLTWKGKLKDEYDGYERNLEYGAYTDDGKAYNGSSTFNASIDAANDGVKLRRRINRNGNGVQTASVYVDGKAVPRLWHIVIPSLSTGKGPVDGWYDSDFEIPASFTKGKKSLNIRVEYVNSPQQGSINEFYYWVYSYTGK